MIKLHHHSNKVGKPPGSLIYTGEKNNKLIMELIEYNKENYNVKKIEKIEDMNLLSTESVSWLDIAGLSNTEYIQHIGERLGINSLVLEDILHIGHRSKIEVFENYTFIIFNVLKYDENTKKLVQEQISMIIFKNLLVTFQEYEKDTFKIVKDIINYNMGHIRQKGQGYLVYSIIDAAVDQYYTMLDNIEAQVEMLEEKIVEDMNDEILNEIYKTRKDLLICRTSVWPIKDVINFLIKENTDLISMEKEYYKDINDHIVHIMDYVLLYREVLSGLLDTQMSNASNKMNKTMTTLTVFSAIFIPLTFIAGVYGMNFRYMPELDNRYGYTAFWVVAISLAVIMLRMFKNKKWI